MIDVATVTSDPGIAELAGGLRLYSARCEVGAHGRPTDLLILPAADGDFCPAQMGDRVLVGCGAGVAYLLRVLVTNAADAGGASERLDRLIQPPVNRRPSTSGSPSEVVDGAVLVGARSGSDWEAVMLYARGHSDFLQLKNSLDTAMSSLIALAVFLDAIVTTAGAAAAANVTALTASKSDLQAVTGGRASSGLKSRPS